LVFSSNELIGLVQMMTLMRTLFLSYRTVLLLTHRTNFPYILWKVWFNKVGSFICYI